ncbi:MAG: molybdopterin-dependent oxidoreductase [Anaerolineae bacterium]|nr:molybdopterin-dependent oxidoreductase [Anaerolineae bacterium]
MLEARPHLSRRAFLKTLAGDPPAEPAHVATSPDPLLTYDTAVLHHAGPGGERFFRQSYRPGAGTPHIDPAAWTLAVGGLVEGPLVLSYEAVRALPAFGEVRTLLCAGNPPGGEWIGNAVWRGFDLDDLLARVGVRSDATHAVFAAADGYTTTVPLDRLAGQSVLMAYEMNGAPLPPEHGYPLRALVPGLYGSKSPKWLTGLRLTNYAEAGTWDRLPGHASGDDAIVTQAQIMTPRPFETLPIGQPVAIQGVALAGMRSITAVAVSVDGGAWMPAALRPPDARHAWTQWYVVWTPELAGVVTLSVRAHDDRGGSAAGHSLSVTVAEV